jgi:hypothetical protein
VRITSIDDFNFRGSAPLSGDFRAVAIAPGSEVDVCMVGSRLLAPGTLVPFDTTVAAVRAYRIGSLGGAASTRIGGKLELVLYEPCDELFAPGLRAPAMASAIIQAADYSAVPRLACRLPFAGRTQAVVAVRTTGGTQPITATVRGVRYLPRNVLLNLTPAQLAASENYFDEDVESLTFAATTVDGAPAGQVVGGMFYVGGNGDLQEAFDELEVWVACGAADGPMYVDIEGSGDRGR